MPTEKGFSLGKLWAGSWKEDGVLEAFPSLPLFLILTRMPALDQVSQESRKELEMEEGQDTWPWDPGHGGFQEQTKSQASDCLEKVGKDGSMKVMSGEEGLSSIPYSIGKELHTLDIEEKKK